MGGLRLGISCAAAAGLAACVSLCAFAPCASAETMDDLNEKYQMAVVRYENVLKEQDRNDHVIAQAEHEIVRVEAELEEANDLADEAAVALYKSASDHGNLIDIVLKSESLSDAIAYVDSYERIEAYYAETVSNARAKRAELDVMRAHLEERKAAIALEVEAARKSMDDAEEAIRLADHSDGAEYHQVQMNGVNCGATSFIVGVNILLHENRYTDNVEVWNEPGFNGNSTTGVSGKGRIWLEDHDLAGTIAVEAVKGDIHTADELRSQLEQGRVVVISSGSGSQWQRADGTAAEPGSFPNGHFIVFYNYKDGIYYANDSSVKTELGAGCPYDEDQMQQWLDGRSNHFAFVMYTVSD